MNRRDLIKYLMAGGVIVAGELWMPGKKLISIPNDRIFYDGRYTLVDYDNKVISWAWDDETIGRYSDSLSFGEIHEAGLITDIILPDRRKFPIDAPWQVNTGDGVSIYEDSV